MRPTPPTDHLRRCARGVHVRSSRRHHPYRVHCLPHHVGRGPDPCSPPTALTTCPVRKAARGTRCPLVPRTAPYARRRTHSSARVRTHPHSPNGSYRHTADAEIG